MKVFLFLTAVLSIMSIQTFGSNQIYNKLACTGARGDHVVVLGIGTDQISVSAGFDPMGIQAMSDGDCAGKKTFCYQEGQWMINIPKHLMNGRHHKGYLWVNSDTDDRSENNRLGDRYECEAVYE